MNGLLQKTIEATGDIVNNDYPIIIGGYAANPLYDVFKGLIDEIRIYNRVLSGTKIQMIYNSQDSDSDGLLNGEDNCPSKANGPDLGTCSATSDKPGITCTADSECANGCSSNGLCIKDQRDGDGVGYVCDGCPNDPNKTAPGACGCGMPDSDSDSDGIADCNDNCPDHFSVTRSSWMQTETE